MRTSLLTCCERLPIQPLRRSWATAPEVIIEFRVDGATENESTREIEAWEQLSTVPAVRRGRVHVLTGNELVVPGPRVAEVTHRLARLLHPDAF